LAPTGVAAINIDGTTVNTGLAIPKETGDCLHSMSDQKKHTIQNLFKRPKTYNYRLNFYGWEHNTIAYPPTIEKNFWSAIIDLFAGISIIAVGDLYQLPPIKKKGIFDDYKNETHNLYHSRRVFRMVELTEIMRQKNYKAFILLLHRVRTASHTEDDMKVIQSRFIRTSDPNYPSDALHIWGFGLKILL
jgi:hypothetical protein